MFIPLHFNNISQAYQNIGKKKIYIYKNRFLNEPHWTSRKVKIFTKRSQKVRYIMKEEY